VTSHPDLTTDHQAPKPVFNALTPQPYGASPYPAAGLVPGSGSGSGSAGAPKSPGVSTGGVLPAPSFGNTLPASNEDSEPIKAWRARQAEEIKARDARDKQARDEMRGKAEKAIDEFYEGYNKVKERNIRENKWVFVFVYRGRVAMWAQVRCHERCGQGLNVRGRWLGEGTGPGEWNGTRMAG
jgi:hypothetical protein